MTWSPVNRLPVSPSAKQRWLEVCPGVATASSAQPVAVEPLAVREHPVGRIIEIEGGVGARAVILDRQRRAADDRRAGRRGERAAGRAVVAMGVGAQDRRDPLARGRGEDGVDMLGEVRPGIDHRHLAGADDIGLGAADR